SKAPVTPKTSTPSALTCALVASALDGSGAGAAQADVAPRRRRQPEAAATTKRCVLMGGALCTRYAALRRRPEAGAALADRDARPRPHRDSSVSGRRAT